MENQIKPKRKLKNLDLIILLSVLAVSLVCSGVVAQLTNQAEGEDFDLFIGRIPRIIGVTASAESYVMHSFPDTNYNGEDHLQVRWQSGDTPESIDISWMKFSIPALDENRTNFSASLILIASELPTGSPNVAITYCANDSWSEASITWNNQPTVYPVYFQDWLVVDDVGTYSFNVTEAVNWALSDATLTLVANTTTDYTTALFNLKPKLEISYITNDPNGIAFQDGKNPSCFIAIYTPVGALNSSDNEFFINADGGGIFTFLANESVSLQFLKSVSANIEGDQGNGVRGINATETGLSGLYPVDPGDRVTIYWIPAVIYPYALPLISFWGMVGGALIGSIFTGAGIKRRNFKILFVGLIAFLAAFIFYLVFVNL